MATNNRAICSICLSEYAFYKGPVVATSCGHVYHSKCFNISYTSINIWLEEKASCPLCEKEVNKETSRIYMSFAAPEEDLDENCDSNALMNENCIITENTPFNNARVHNSTLMLKAFISQEIHKQNKDLTEMMMTRVKLLMDPLINEVVQQSKKPRLGYTSDRNMNQFKINNEGASSTRVNGRNNTPSEREQLKAILRATFEKLLD